MGSSGRSAEGWCPGGERESQEDGGCGGGGREGLEDRGRAEGGREGREWRGRADGGRGLGVLAVALLLVATTWGSGAEAATGKRCLVGWTGPCMAGPKLVETTAEACTRTYFFPKAGLNTSIYHRFVKFDGCLPVEGSGCIAKLTRQINVNDAITEGSRFDEEVGFILAFFYLKANLDKSYICAPSQDQGGYLVNPVRGAEDEHAKYATVTCICLNKKGRPCNEMPLALFTANITWENYVVYGKKSEEAKANKIVGKESEPGTGKSFVPAIDYRINETEKLSLGPCPIAVSLEAINCRKEGSSAAFLESAFRQVLLGWLKGGSDCGGAKWCSVLEGEVGANFGGVEYGFQIELTACSRLLEEKGTGISWALLSPEEVKTQVSEPCQQLKPGEEKNLNINYTQIGTPLVIEAKGTQLVFKPTKKINLTCISTATTTTTTTTTTPSTTTTTATTTTPSTTTTSTTAPTTTKPEETEMPHKRVNIMGILVGAACGSLVGSLVAAFCIKYTFDVERVYNAYNGGIETTKPVYESIVKAQNYLADDLGKHQKNVKTWLTKWSSAEKKDAEEQEKERHRMRKEYGNIQRYLWASGENVNPEYNLYHFKVGGQPCPCKQHTDPTALIDRPIPAKYLMEIYDSKDFLIKNGFADGLDEDNDNTLMEQIFEKADIIPVQYPSENETQIDSNPPESYNNDDD